MRTLAFVLALLGSLAGCAGAQKATPTPEVPVPVIDRAPVAVGVRYAQSLLSHHCKGGEGYIAFDWSYELGPPSVAMFAPLFDAMFREARTLEPGLAQGGTDVVEVDLKTFTGCDASWPILGTTWIDVSYEAVLRDAGGAELTRWTGTGRAGPADEVQDLMRPADDIEIAYLNALVSLAMRRAATDFLVRFERDAVVRARYYAR